MGGYHLYEWIDSMIKTALESDGGSKSVVHDTVGNVRCDASLNAVHNVSCSVGVDPRLSV